MGLYLLIYEVQCSEDSSIRVSALQPDVKIGFLRFEPDLLSNAVALAWKQSRTPSVQGLYL